jgi:AcrR family transcriptional regulator
MMGNRESLLEAAIVCLRERGYAATTARDLAQTAGVSLGAIGYHFGSTEVLLNEAIAESSRRWIKHFRESLARPAHPAGLAAASRSLYDVFAANRGLLVGFVEAFARAQRSEAARTQLAGHYDEFRREIALALSAGEPPAHTESIASVLIALVDGLIIQWILAPERCPDPETLQRAASALVQLQRRTDQLTP